MNATIYERSITLPVPVSRLWEWHGQPGAFERLSPAWQTLQAEDLPERLEAETEARFRLRKGPFSLLWRARIGPVEREVRFVDTQAEGPFAAWRHEHLFRAESGGGSTLTDRVSYRLPGGLSRIPWIRERAQTELDRLFAFRHARMAADLARTPGDLPGRGRVVLVTGSSGLIGGRLVPYLKTLGYTVRGLSRRGGAPGIFSWNPASGEVDPAALEGVDAVIHLAGENIASGRWTRSRRERILSSRVEGTRTLVEAMAAQAPPPAVLVSASGIDAGGDGFLAEVCRRWEAEAMRATEAGTRVVCLRTAVVLDPMGGALGKMLPAFQMGLGGPIGNGRQGFPWIAIDDLLDIILQAVENPSLSGPIEAVHPDRVDQRTFSRVLAGLLGRPAWVPLPAWVVKLLFGQMGKETLLASHFIEPERLREAGFAYRHPTLQAALAFLLGKGL